MTNIFASAASGMKAQQARLDTIGNNLANLGTTGFKANRVDLASLPEQPAQLARAGDGTQPRTELGEGVAIAGSTRSFANGPLQVTGNPLDLAIAGPGGFFQISLGPGRFAYTRDGAFQVAADGRIVTGDGYPLDPPITLPPGAQVTGVTPHGIVMGTLPGADEPQELGRIMLATFPNPGGLETLGGNRFVASVASGPATLGEPGAGGMPELRGGMLEAANVEMAEQATMMIEAQRAYSLSARSAQTLDEMLGVLLQTRS